MDLLHTQPINKNASRVTKCGEHFAPRKKIETLHKSVPPKIEPGIPKYVASTFQDLTGRKRGRLTVVGLLKGSLKVWVCRCDCGRYTARRAKAIKNENNIQDRCDECRHLAFLQREEVWRRTGVDQDIKDF
ncbi:hypothetical protein ACXITX_22815 [Vibrio parahaemolyticus]